MSIHSVNFDSGRCLPDELCLHMLSSLNAKDLVVVNLVCKHWNQLTKKDALLYKLDVKKLFDRVSFIDTAAWQAKVDLDKYGLSFKEQCVDQCKMIKQLQKCLAWPIEKINGIKPGVTVITILKGLSLNKLCALAPQACGFINDEFIKNYGNIETSDAYTLIITDHVMSETREKEGQQQLTEIEQHGGKRPKAIEVMTLLILTFLISGKRLYNEVQVVLKGRMQHLFTYTACEEQVLNSQVYVGGFHSNGIRVPSYSFDGPNFGLGACMIETLTQ